MKSNTYVGRCLAAVAGGFLGWLAGAHFSARWSWVGMLIGAVLFAVLEDVPRTLRVAREVGKSIKGWRPDRDQVKFFFTLIGKALAVIGVFLFAVSSWILILPLPMCSSVDKLIMPFIFYMASIGVHIIIKDDFLTEEQVVEFTPAGALFMKEKKSFGEICRTILMVGNVFSGLVLLFLLVILVFKGLLFAVRWIPKIIYFFLVTIPKWMLLVIIRLASQQKTATGMLGTAIGVAIGLWCGTTILCGGIGAISSLLLVVFADALAMFAKRFEKPTTVATVSS